MSILLCRSQPVYTTSIAGIHHSIRPHVAARLIRPEGPNEICAYALHSVQFSFQSSIFKFRVVKAWREWYTCTGHCSASICTFLLQQPWRIKLSRPSCEGLMAFTQIPGPILFIHHVSWCMKLFPSALYSLLQYNIEVCTLCKKNWGGTDEPVFSNYGCKEWIMSDKSFHPRHHFIIKYIWWFVKFGCFFYLLQLGYWTGLQCLKLTY